MPAQEHAVTHHVLTDPGPVLASAATRPGVLLVREMDAPAFYQLPRLVYSRAPGTRAHYEYARWSEPPAQRLGWLLRQRLEASRVFEAVAPLGGSVRGDYQLNTRLVDFFHDSASPPGAALLVLEADLVRRADARLVARRMFVAQEPVAAYDAGGAADALGLAANRVIDDLTVWLGQVVAVEPR
jgi:cholesterol transport system auxiliary component